MENNLIEKAISIASLVHKGQVDKQGRPYILHVIRVGLRGKTDEEIIVGLLHDTIEDHPNSESLIRDNFPPWVIQAVSVLTKAEHENYMDYIERVKEHDLPRAVKLNDLRDNTDPARGEIPESLLTRYRRAFLDLT